MKINQSIVQHMPINDIYKVYNEMIKAILYAGYLALCMPRVYFVFVLGH